MNRNNPMHVLFISEDDLHRKRIADSMSSWGYPLVLRPDVASMQSHETIVFDLIILDLDEPGNRNLHDIPLLKARFLESRMVTITWTNSRPLEVAARKHGVACYLVASDKMKDLKDVLDHTADQALKNHARHTAA